ncbi:hypothetical protein D7Y42_15185 [Stenotrophomonas maltophilia]|nr:hypothetical protein [Stenotrophomonas maltophilia]MBA0303369.1 hypothetical protein [Stenotrophomonas maltophilia]MBA0372027.1 hypothetical protein [Stenotrophomonas maltophilia]PWI02139.1 hypothetical protein DI494_12185 [Stenotrophomonas maltophilia]TIL15657.1 hypothetical protein E4419_09020 [Stenotrophomonas maltophilia]
MPAAGRQPRNAPQDHEVAGQRPALPVVGERGGTAGTCAISPACIHRRMQSLHTLHGSGQE